MSRRTVFSLVLLLLVAAWFLVTGSIRAHVNDLIQHSVGKPMPEFALADRAGRVWTTADLKGKRAVLHVFRSRCHSCDVEAPAMLELEGKLAQDTVLLADAKFVDAFHTVNWSNVTPITYVVDAAGVVRFGLRGAQTRGAIEEALAASR